MRMGKGLEFKPYEQRLKEVCFEKRRLKKDMMEDFKYLKACQKQKIKNPFSLAMGLGGRGEGWYRVVGLNYSKVDFN